MPVKTTAKISAGPATDPITAGIANIPEPIIPPTPNATNVKRPISRFRVEGSFETCFVPCVTIALKEYG
jgi:hypothetical protein